MRPGIALRPDYDAAQLRALAKASRNAGQSRRLLALAEIYDGGSRTKAARIGGVGLQTVRDWVVRFNARGPDGLIDGKAPGNTCKLIKSQRQALATIVESGPTPAIHGVVRWRLKDLTLWVWEEFRISISETTLSRELRGLGYRKLSARPRHYAQNPEALEAFKKNLPATLEAIRAGLPNGTPIELWWQDEARVGQKNKIARRWARRGTRPRAPHDQRTSSVSIFGAICPQEGKGAALVLPRCDTQAMSLHLAEVAQAVAPGAHGVMLMDRAGWRPHQGPRRARQPHAGAAASPSARIEPGREHLAVSARELVVEPRVRLLRRHRRSLLRRVEPPHRPALDHHVHRPPGLGQCIQCMMISAGWYKHPRQSKQQICERMVKEEPYRERYAELSPETLRRQLCDAAAITGPTHRLAEWFYRPIPPQPRPSLPDHLVELLSSFWEDPAETS